MRGADFQPCFPIAEKMQDEGGMTADAYYTFSAPDSHVRKVVLGVVNINAALNAGSKNYDESRYSCGRTGAI